MEPYVRENTGKFPLSSLSEETAKGVGITGASVPSRALLGLQALYAAVDVNRRDRAPGSAGSNAPSSSSRLDRGAAVSGPAARGGGAGSRGVTGNRSSKEQPVRDGGGRGGIFSRSLRSAPQPPPPARVSPESFAAMPLLGHRYKFVSMIGTGRFSDVIRAEDTFRPGRSVAIKLINIGCEAVALREVRFMRFLGSVPNAEYCPVVKLLDVLTFEGHLCLVTELFGGTLSFQEVGGDARHPEDGKAAAAPAPALTPEQSRRGTGPARGSTLGLHDQGMRNDRGGLQGFGGPAEPGSGSGPAAWGSDGVAGVGGPELSSSSCDRLDTSSERRSRSGCAATPGPLSPSGDRCPAHVIRHVALQLVSALLLLRNHGLIHADIKPENVLLKVEEGQAGGVVGRGRGSPARRVGLWDLVRGRARMKGIESLTVRLCDFGNAIHKSEAYLYYGDFEIQTLAYRAPEVLMGCPFGPAVDVWSVGVILLELLIGRPLFDTAGSRAALLQQMVCAFGPMPLRRFRVGHFFSEYYAQDQSIKVGTSQNLRLLSLLAGMLSFDPDERLTPLQALAHPFFGEALPFTDLPQTTMAAAAEHPRKAPAVEPADQSRAKERGHGSSAPPSTQQHRSRQSVATLPLRSPALARPSTHRQQEPSPSLRGNGSSGGGGGGGGGGVDNARREAAASKGIIRPNGGNKRSLDEPGVATAARHSSPSRPGAASGNGNGNGTSYPSCQVDNSETSNASRDVDPTAQLRRLAEMAGAMVSKGSPCYSRGRDSSGTGAGSGTGSGD
eukprot:g6817.t1